MVQGVRSPFTDTFIMPLCVYPEFYTIHYIGLSYYNFKNCSQISIEFGMYIILRQELMLKSAVLKLTTSPDGCVCVHTLRDTM